MYRFLDPDIESMILLMVRNTVMIQRDDADISRVSVMENRERFTVAPHIVQCKKK